MSFFSSIGKFLFGEKSKQVPIYNQGQQQLLDRITSAPGTETNPAYKSGMDYLQRILSNDPATMEAFEAPYRQQFEQQVIPGIAERFAGMGAGGQSSSAFRNQLGQAGGDYTTGLAALRAQLQQNALPQALNYARAPMQDLATQGQAGLSQSPFQYQQGSPGFVAPILGAIGSSLGGGVGLGVGTAVGSGLGNIISNWFKSGPNQTQQSQSSASLG